MNSEENKRKHLEFIQLVITRMNVNSFLVKGWNITIVAALFALSAKDTDRGFIILSFFPTLIFWGLDTYYLRQERLFRHLYDKIRKIKEENIDYDMNTNEFKENNNVKVLTVFKSITISFFYLSILIIIVIMILFIKNLKG
jgi:hypothetical protein